VRSLKISCTFREQTADNSIEVKRGKGCPELCNANLRARCWRRRRHEQLRAGGADRNLTEPNGTLRGFCEYWTRAPILRNEANGNLCRFCGHSARSPILRNEANGNLCGFCGRSRRPPILRNEANGNLCGFCRRAIVMGNRPSEAIRVGNRQQLKASLNCAKRTQCRANRSDAENRDRW
jgi:hypothetical protein